MATTYRKMSMVSTCETTSHDGCVVLVGLAGFQPVHLIAGNFDGGCDTSGSFLGALVSGCCCGGVEDLRSRFTSP